MKQSTIRRWGPWLALVLLFAIATSLLSWWQFSRRAERVERIDQVIQNYDLKPVPYSDIDWVINPDGTSDQEWTPVEVTGTYLPELATVVRNRPLNGQPGFLQLVPLRLPSGELLIVERGWLFASSELVTPDSNPLPSGDEHSLTLRLRVSEPDLNRDDVVGQIASIDLPRLAERFAASGEVIEEHYGRVVTEQPSYQDAPFPMPKPTLNEGNHLSYAIQWIIFGVMAFAAFFWALRNDRRIRLDEAGLIEPKQQKRTQAVIDAEYEDLNQ